MGTLIGLGFALGILLMSTARPRAARTDDRSAVGIVAKGREHLPALGIAVAVAVATLVLTGLPLVAAMAAVVGFCVPRLLQRRARRRHWDRRRSAWPDVIDSMAGAVRAGLSLPEAVCAVAGNGPACLRGDFAEFTADYRVTGSFETSVMALRQRLADPIADRMVEALLTAREVGGHDLGRVLRSLSEFVRQELRLRGEAEARRSWTVNGARLAAAAPWLVLVFLSSRPGTVEAYRTPLGSVILVAAAAATAVAYTAMIKIGRLPEEPRVLVPMGPAR